MKEKKSGDPGVHYARFMDAAIRRWRLDLLDLVIMLCSECRSASAPGVARIVLREIYELGLPLRANKKSIADILAKQAVEESLLFGGNHGGDFPNLQMLADGLQVDPDTVRAELAVLGAHLAEWIQQNPPHRLTPQQRLRIKQEEKEKKEMERKGYSRAVDKIKKLAHDRKRLNRKLKEQSKS